MKLSICILLIIPSSFRKLFKLNFNLKQKVKILILVCVSDNGSKHNIKIVNKFNKKFDIKFHKFKGI